MLTAVKLVDQWATVERRLPSDWESVELRLRTEQPDERSEAARILGPMNVGFVGEELAFSVRRAGGASGPHAAHRLFARLDEARAMLGEAHRIRPSLDREQIERFFGRRAAAELDAVLG